MTIQTDDRPTRRETASYYRGRALMVQLRGRYLEIREKGRRDVVSVEYGAIYELGLKIRWRRERAEKQKDRQSKGGRRR